MSKLWLPPNHPLTLGHRGWPSSPNEKPFGEVKVKVKNRFSGSCLGVWGMTDGFSNGVITDLTGQNNATITNGTYKNRTIDLDGSWDYVTVDNEENFRLPQGTFISVLVLRSYLAEKTSAVFIKDKSGWHDDAIFGIGVYTDDSVSDELSFTIQPSSPQVRQTCRSNEAFPLNVQSTIACDWGPQGMRLYKDGEFVDSNNWTGGIVAADEPLRMGTVQLLSGRWLNGEIRLGIVLDKQYSQAEIQNLTLDVYREFFEPANQSYYAFPAAEAPPPLVDTDTLWLPPDHPLTLGHRGWPSSPNKKPTVPMEPDWSAYLWSFREHITWASSFHGGRDNRIIDDGDPLEFFGNAKITQRGLEPNGGYVRRDSGMAHSESHYSYVVVFEAFSDASDAGFSNVLSSVADVEDAQITWNHTNESLQYASLAKGSGTWRAVQQPGGGKAGFHAVVFSWSHQNYLIAARNGASDIFLNPGNQGFNQGDIRLGAHSSGGSFDGVIHFAAAFADYALSQAESEEITDNFYKAFQPTNRSHYAFPGVAAVGPPEYDETATVQSTVVVTGTEVYTPPAAPNYPESANVLSTVVVTGSESWAVGYTESAKVDATVVVTGAEQYAGPAYTESAKIDSTVVVTATETFGTAYDETARIESTVVVSAAEVFTPPIPAYDESAKIDSTVVVTALEQYIGPAYTESAKIDSTVVVTAVESYGTGFQESANILSTVVVTGVESWTPPAFTEQAMILSTVVVNAQETFDTPSRLPGGIETLSAELIGGFYARKI